MGDYSLLFPGKYLASADFQGKDVTLTIKSVYAEEIEDKPKAVMSFEATKKLLVLNRTNAESVVLMFGRETIGWVGKRVTFYPATMKDPFGDGEITAIRVRGSPDIDKPANKEVKRGRKTIRVSVVPTGKGQPPKQPQKGKPSGPPPPMSDEDKAAAEALERGLEPGSGG